LKTHFPLPISEGSDDTLVQSPAVAKMMVGVTSSAWK
jgi:hypothetical protein